MILRENLRHIIVSYKLLLVELCEYPFSKRLLDCFEVYLRRSIAGSMIGGIKETQEMLDFCAEKGIVSDVEMIAMKDINVAYDRMVKNDVRYRFVIDMKTL